MRVKLTGPAAFKVDGIYQDQAGRRVQQTRRNEIADPALGLVAGPMIDFQTGGLSLVAKIGRSYRGSKLLLRNI